MKTTNKQSEIFSRVWFHPQNSGNLAGLLPTCDTTEHENALDPDFYGISVGMEEALAVGGGNHDY